MNRLKPPFAPPAPAPALVLALALALAYAAVPARADALRPATPEPSPQHLWEAWRDGRSGHLADCVPGGTCPPVDQAGRKVRSCYYESDFKTGWRCILFCDYGGDAPWGSDGGGHCD